MVFISLILTDFTTFMLPLTSSCQTYSSKEHQKTYYIETDQVAYAQDKLTHC